MSETRAAEVCRVYGYEARLYQHGKPVAIIDCEGNRI